MQIQSSFIEKETGEFEIRAKVVDTIETEEKERNEPRD